MNWNDYKKEEEELNTSCWNFNFNFKSLNYFLKNCFAENL